MSSHLAHKTDFWTLLQNYTVEIPKIQRDYAQGRTDEKTTSLADEFLCSIKTAICNNEPLNLDFIYGKTEGEKPEKTVLIPIDGQQRLTTLFLLHWYAAAKEKKLTEAVKSILSKFTYETRLSSRDFCKSLINKSIDSFNGDIVKTIKDSPWYFLSWEHDPTVCAMLTMINRIDTWFKDISIPLFDQLTGSGSSEPECCPITFYFLPLENFQLNDELYIRMNARGKPLTEFEHFKVLFSEYLPALEEKAKLDTKWLDIFWNYEIRQAKKKGKKINSEMADTVDRYFFTFFSITARQFYAEKQRRLKDDYFSLLKEYRTVYEDSTAVQKTVHILNALCRYEDNESFFAAILDNPAPTYHDQLRFYALTQYLIWQESLHSGDNEPNIYKQWMRVTVNLINNTLVDNAEDYGKAVQSINALSGYISNLYAYLQKKNTDISFFSGIQKTEERLKAALIVEDSAWEDVLIKAERHEYFDGQIGFILNYANTANGYDIARFQTYVQKLSVLFSTQFRCEYEKTSDQFLFQRALLHYGNYLPEYGYNHTFCEFTASLRAKNDNWRRVFNDEKRALLLKALLDDLPNNTGSLPEEAIAAALKDRIAESDSGDWRHLFIKEPRHICYCGQRYIRFSQNNPDDPHAKIYLISRKQLNSYHCELYSRSLYLNVFKGATYPPFTKLWYYESASYEEACIAVDNFFYTIQDTCYHFYMDIVHKGNQRYTVKFGERNQRTLPPEITAVLKKVGFRDATVINGVPESEVKEKIQEIAENLNQLVQYGA